MTRLNLLRLNTMPAMDVRILEDLSRLELFDNVQLRELGRLPYPMLRERGACGFHRIGWEEAYRRISDRIRRTEPKRLAFYLTARGLTNEVYYVAQKVARFLGTNNIDNAARLCHAPSTAAMKDSLGVAASTCSYKDWYGTDIVVFFGSNPANAQPVAMKYLHEAKRLGTKVVLVNPYREPGMERYWVPSTVSSAIFGTDIADYWFQVATGGDLAFVSGVLKIMVENDWVNHEFIARHTSGFDQLEAALRQLSFPALEVQSGLSKAAMQEFAELMRDAKTAVLVWSMGITQHALAADSVQMILNLGLAKGFVGRDKCGLMPIRGHSSVQGGAEMGAYATALPGGKPVNPENAAVLSKFYGFHIPESPGLNALEMVEACLQEQVDVLYSLGGNFLRTLPNPEQVRQALGRVPLRVHQDIIFNDQMLIDSAEQVILLPAKTRYEQDDGGIETSTERRIMFSPEIPRQVGEARAEWKILRELACAVSPERAALLGCETGWAIREEIARVVPFYDGVQHLRDTGDAVQYGGRHLCENGKFPTPDGKAHFRVALPAQTKGTRGSIKPEVATFILSTRRGKQFNSLIYAQVDPLNRAPRDAVLINPEDARDLRLSESERIRLVNEVGSYECRVFPAPIARGNLQVHWPEGNVLLAKGVVEPRSGVPDYNTRVRIEKTTGA
jgi:molybdopterin-dependent oxidoreductase alpha subunit